MLYEYFNKNRFETVCLDVDDRRRGQVINQLPRFGTLMNRASNESLVDTQPDLNNSFVSYLWNKQQTSGKTTHLSPGRYLLWKEKLRSEG